jgi:hypothetical protein
LSINNLDDRERALGVVVLRLLSTRERWMHRRVESVSLVDSVVFQRRVSVDFSIDPDLATPFTDADGEPIYHVPLGLLRKRKLVGFSLYDESGRALSLPTSAQNCAVAAAVLLAAAEANVGSDMPEKYGKRPPVDVEEEIFKIATEKDHKIAVGYWKKLGRQDQLSASSREWRARLSADRNFMALAYDFARNFPVMTPLRLEAGRQRVIKYCYHEYRSTPPLLKHPWPLARLREVWFYAMGRKRAVAAMRKGDAKRGRIKFWDWLRVFVGWFPQSLKIDTPAMYQGGTYHFEIEAPEGLHITQATLYGTRSGSVLDMTRTSTQRAHLYADAPPPDDPETAKALVKLRVRNATFVRAAVMISALTAAMLVGLTVFWGDTTDTLSSVPSFLLVVPTALAAYVARAREPATTTERLFGLRLVAMSAGVWSFLAAILLVVGRECPSDPSQPCTSWSGTSDSLISLAGLSVLTLFFLLGALTFGSRPPEQKP